MSFYERLYEEDELHRPLYVHRGLFLPLSNLQMEEVQKPFTMEEVKTSLFAMKPWKAPGVDGIQAGFYQKHWDVLDQNISMEVVRILEGGKMDARMNRTLICLIPKIEAPKLMAQFRPIALYSVAYN